MERTGHPICSLDYIVPPHTSQSRWGEFCGPRKQASGVQLRGLFQSPRVCRLPGQPGFGEGREPPGLALSGEPFPAQPGRAGKEDGRGSQAIRGADQGPHTPHRVNAWLPGPGLGVTPRIEIVCVKLIYSHCAWCGHGS